MGIPRGCARLLLEEHRRRSFSGSVLQLGRSTVYCTRPEPKVSLGARLEERLGGWPLLGPLLRRGHSQVGR